MIELSFSLFETPLGRCGMAWGASGVTAISFAYPDAVDTSKHLRRRAPEATEVEIPPDNIRRVIAGIIKLFEGESQDLTFVHLDLTGIGQFERDVYVCARAVRPGTVRTYGDLAKALGDVALSRRVGQALGRNPFPIVIPCHRIVGSGGAMTGFSAPGGAELKRKLLKIEGALEPELFDKS